jgi:hypothetical protein
MKKLNRTELEVITKKIIAGIREKHEEEEREFLKEKASDIEHWKNRTMFDIEKNPCIFAHFSSRVGPMEKTVEKLVIYHVKKIYGFKFKDTPYSSEVFNALILAQIECPDLDTLMQKVTESFTKG